MLHHFHWNQDAKEERDLRERVVNSPLATKKLSEDGFCFSKLV